MTIPTSADLLQILRASPDVRAAAAALMKMSVPIDPPNAPHNKPLVKPQRLLQRAALDALAAAGVRLVDRPVAWGRLHEGAPDVWTLHAKIRVPRGTPGACGSALSVRVLLSSILEEAR
jgi:hypothetical protein